MTDLFDAPAEFPESVLLSIYNAYPRKTGRPAALKRINEALSRICMGEIDGQPRTQAEAIEFLRVKTEEARWQMGAREQKFIPHMATWLHQSRYLRPELAAQDEIPKRMDTCLMILEAYPNTPSARQIADNVNVWRPALMAIDKALDAMMSHNQHLPQEHYFRRLRSRTELYAMAVKQWPAEDLKYVPNPKRWYEEARYEQPEQIWQRKASNGFEIERDQLRNITLQ
jgi:hypothetical protein